MENTNQNAEDYVSKEEYLGLSEAALLLEISQDELNDLIQKHKIHIHPGLDASVKLKRKDLELIKNKWRIERELFPQPEKYFSHHQTVGRPTFFERIADFWYFNDFYIICGVLIVALAYLILSSQ